MSALTVTLGADFSALARGMAGATAIVGVCHSIHGIGVNDAPQLHAAGGADQVVRGSERSSKLREQISAVLLDFSQVVK